MYCIYKYIGYNIIPEENKKSGAKEGKKKEEEVKRKRVFPNVLFYSIVAC